MTPCQKLLKQEGTARRSESMQQSSTTQSQSLVFGGCGRLLHALTPPRSAFLFQQFLARCHPYILLHDFYTCIIYISVVWTSIPQLFTRFFLRVIFSRMHCTRSIELTWASQLRQSMLTRTSTAHGDPSLAAPMLTTRFSYTRGYGARVQAI